MIDEKVTWESTDITYRTYLPPTGWSDTTTAEPVPLRRRRRRRHRRLRLRRRRGTCCKRKQVRTRYGRSPDRTSLGVFSPPPPPRLRHRLSIKSARSHSKNDQPIEPPRPHHITADPIRSIEEAARWVGFPSHPDTHAGAGTGPGRRIVAFSRGGIPNSVLGFGFSTGFMVWVGR